MITIENVPPETAEKLCRKITTDLPEYFGLPEANEYYAAGIRSRSNLAAKVDSDYVGLISIDFPYPDNAGIYWMAILHGCHGKGIGRKLAEAAFRYAKHCGAKSITVETLAPFESDENYLKTYNFYRSLGFSPLFNLKPAGYEWNMVYMMRLLEPGYDMNKICDISSRKLDRVDIPGIINSFRRVDWPKPASLFESYFSEQRNEKRLVWLAFYHEQFAGYVTLKWQSLYKPFTENNIPEIMDLNVLPQYRKCGVGSYLLHIAEQEAAKRSSVVGIGVGLYAGIDGGYGNAQRLYVKLGYIPDGRGVTYHYEPVKPGSSHMVNDDLVLWFTKKLR